MLQLVPTFTADGPFVGIKRVRQIGHGRVQATRTPLDPKNSSQCVDAVLLVTERKTQREAQAKERREGREGVSKYEVSTDT